MLMRRAGLAAIERKVSSSSADSTSSPFPLPHWPSKLWKPVTDFQVAGWSPVCRFKSHLGVLGIVVQSFLPLGELRSLKLTPQPELEADLVLSVTQKAGLCGHGGTSLHMHKVCVLDLTGLWAFFPLIHPRLHPLHMHHMCLRFTTFSKYFSRVLNALNPL